MNTTNTAPVADADVLTLDKLRQLIAQIPDYALLTSSPLIRGDDVFKIPPTPELRSVVMGWVLPPACRYMIVVAPERLLRVAKELNARVSSRMGDGNVYEFYVKREGV